MRGLKQQVLAGAAVLFFGSIFLLSQFAVYAQSDEGFSLQVSPSPLVATVKPGVDTILELQIRNTNTSQQALKMGLRPFMIDDSSGQVKLGDTVSQEIKSLVSFDTPTFTLTAGQIYTERVHIKASATSGFSYNFAVTISQQNPPKGANGKSAIAGSVAVFTLISVDKPGANRKLELSSLSVSRRVYEYLPAEIQLALRNTGNTNVQPTGSVFIYPHGSSTEPLASLALNDSGGYILPGKTRTFTVAWSDGFPHYESVKSGDTTKKLVWHGTMAQLRFGKYDAKIVAIYNDGERDIPVMATISFWVIPWRILLIGIGLLIVLLIGFFVTARSFIRAARRTSSKLRVSNNKKNSSDDA